MPHRGEMVKTVLRARGMAQVELARKIGRDQTLISKYLSCRIEVSDKVARSIAKVLDMDFEKLHSQLQRDRLARRMERLETQFGEVLGEGVEVDASSEQAYLAAYAAIVHDFAVIPMLDAMPVSASGWSKKGTAKYPLPIDSQVNAETAFAVRIAEKDMTGGEVAKGDIVVIDVGAEVADGDTVLVAVGKKPMLRKIYRRGSNIVLQALGDSAEPVIFLSQEDDSEIIGRVALCTKLF